MTIEDGLEELEDNNKKPESEKQPEDIGPCELQEDARKIMGEALVNYFSGNLHQQKQCMHLHRITKELVQQYGLDFFTIHPPSRRRSAASLCVNIPEKVIKDALKLLCGEYILQTDVANYAKRDSMEELEKVIPELETVYVQTIRVSNEVEHARTVLNPYIITMSMSNTNRPLAVIAIKNADERGVIKIPNEIPSKIFERWITDAIANVAPEARDFSEAAKKYNVQTIIPIIKEFKHVCGAYVDALKAE